MSWLSLVAQLGININPFTQGLMKAKAEASTFGTSVAGSLKGKLAGAFTIGAAVAAGKSAMDFAGHIKDLSDRLDVSTDTLQEWNFAATQTGANADNVAQFFEHIAASQDKALEGNEEAIANFKKFGVTIKDLENMRVEGIGKKIAAAVHGGDIQQLSGSLKELGGKSATMLAAAFKGGMEDMARDAHDFGLVIDSEIINKTDEFGDRLGLLKTRLMVMTSGILAFINGAMGGMAKWITLIGGYLAEWDSKAFRFKKTFGEYKNSPEARELTKDFDGPAATPAAQPSARKFSPKTKDKKSSFDSDLLGKQVGRLNVDSLASIGGFVGNAANANPVVDLARQQLEQQKKIAKNTEPKPGSGDKFSYS